LRGVVPGLVLVSVLSACGDDSSGPEEAKDPTELTFAPALGVDLGQMTKTASGLYWQDLLVGQGTEAQAGDSVTVHYEGWLHTGVKFDSSLDRGEPFSSNLNGLIVGWQEGIPGMKEGGRRKLVIPPALGYGSVNLGAIPPNSTLVFDIDLIEVHDGS
jgi:peptidylprolyl isomerase